LQAGIAAFTGRGLDFGDAVVDCARAVVTCHGELVVTAAMRAAVRELIALADGTHDRKLTAMLASHGVGPEEIPAATAEAGDNGKSGI
jgi:hypothetical protein